MSKPRPYFCPFCGNPKAPGSKRCSYCGRESSDSRAVKKWTAFWLCVFLGEFGAHKFYEGKVGMGLIYLFTAGLFGIGWVIDAILIFLKPNPYYV